MMSKLEDPTELCPKEPRLALAVMSPLLSTACRTLWTGAAQFRE